MFKRFVLASDYNRIRQKFDMASLPQDEEYIPSFNIAPNDSAYVVKSEQTINTKALDMPLALQSFFQDKIPTRAIRSFKFGLQGVERNTKYFIRSEGDRNLKNDPNYTGSKAIFLNHKYKRIIREQRCLVIADAFIIGIDTKPYLVYLKDKKRPFGFAGLWNATTDEKGQEIHSFGILTTVANPLLRKLGHDRMPVIIREQNERRWFSKSTELSQVLAMLNPYPHHLMNAYPISDKIKDVQNNDLSIIQPIGSRIYSERIEPLSRKRVKVERPVFDTPNMGEVAKMNRSML
jgi:putative SOS response-associated peptidase YedK